MQQAGVRNWLRAIFGADPTPPVHTYRLKVAGSLVPLLSLKLADVFSVEHILSSDWAVIYSHRHYTGTRQRSLFAECRVATHHFSCSSPSSSLKLFHIIWKLLNMTINLSFIVVEAFYSCVSVSWVNQNNCDWLSPGCRSSDREHLYEVKCFSLSPGRTAVKLWSLESQ